MEDVIDGGFSIETGGATGDFSAIGFNDKRQYSPTASRFIIEMKDYITANGSERVGFVTTISNEGGTDSQAYVISQAVSSNYELVTANTTSVTVSDSLLAKDTNWHKFVLVLASTFVKMYADGVLRVISTTNLPDVKLQPRVASRFESSNAGKVGIRYFEAYNT